MQQLKEQQYIDNQTLVEREMPDALCIVEEYSRRHPHANEWALKDISFDMAPGETVAVVGDSGSGKSTLMDSIAGFSDHFYTDGTSDGSIYLRGLNVALTDPFQLAPHFGFVTQQFRSQVFSQSVLDSLAFGMENMATPREQMVRRVEELVRIFHLTDILHRRVTDLSGGQAQAVALASMFAKGPPLMLLDDVASDLDPRAQDRYKQIVNVMQQNGVGILISDAAAPEWLLKAADNVLVLQEGRQVYFGPPLGITSNPELASYAGLLEEFRPFRERHAGLSIAHIANVSYSYGSVRAVDNVTTTIMEGSITGIIGHNGSGKTTLMKILGGLYSSHEGEVSVAGIHPASVSARDLRRIIAYVPQNVTGITLGQSVDEELQFTPRALGMEAEVRVEDTGLSGKEQIHPENLSAGERQRLIYGAALSVRPKVLLLDEPTKGLNQVERRKLADSLIELQRQGLTIIIVSHDFGLIRATTNDVKVMEDGRLVREGPTVDVMQDRNLFQDINLPLPW